MKTPKKATKKQTVKLFGQIVTVGTKEHARLVYQQKLFSQNNDY